MEKHAEDSAIMLSKDGESKGRIINFEAKPCSMEGCGSYRASVRWEDGKLTYPCMSMVIEIEKGIYQLT